MKKSAALKIFDAARKTETKGFKLEDVLFTGIIRTKAKMPVPHFEKVKMNVDLGIPKLTRRDTNILKTYSHKDFFPLRTRRKIKRQAFKKANFFL